ncbi:D-glycero-alpha-D-manno-heptose-7-phosphate kinase [Clostridium acetobutylicum]|uniref:Sugar kinase n=1 Tax=Clostridium acetobutylicum (strain ATCC 824 / DSM 792 / JCM 1419 / IAM 19013 / LMG 5710 / NBRC 13948 / NRRL B-527 / VKM B-1787 / 2291 / W) TaxID=272562 RepID=Q97EQ3_CLOAB|nr:MULTISPECIES: GHMP kinase [Clostridium]AAK80995.1 Sugar kinase [Clostridium acetobutylicum ATCC 824]ADZ22098.1 Sugar kinase [Clostridium acetobutylicum EA 2018]AEI33479.1 sugar kinase [Clostridium acetobutylicum DSM 1731]AWV78594.1 GHMP kinase [Clostridium acetobutylicum]KHD35748.1 GHMP kinase [Clostridium acetobutylicum]
MIIRAKAPLRISFGGGGTDVEPYCNEYGGVVLNTTIDKYAYCSIVPNNTDSIVVNSLDFDMTVKYNCNENLVYDGKLDLVKAALKRMNINKGCEVYLQCDAPAGSGLGTSSTVVVALLGAMAKWKGVVLDQYALASIAYEVERKDLKIDGGYQDQYAAAFGGFNFMEVDGSDVVVNPLKINKGITNELQYNLLLCYTGNVHVSANIIKDQVNNYVEKKEEVVNAMHEIKALAYAMKKELLRNNLNNFGSLLHYGWEMKKKMSSRISNPQIDELYEAALKKGALGGKLLGAGGGGYLLVYCPYNKKHVVAESLEKMGGQLTDWNFDLGGMQSWVVDDSRWNYNEIAVATTEGKYKFGINTMEDIG